MKTEKDHTKGLFHFQEYDRAFLSSNPLRFRRNVLKNYFKQENENKP